MQSATNGKERRDGSHVYPGCRREQAEQPNRRDGGTLTPPPLGRPLRSVSPIERGVAHELRCWHAQSVYRDVR